MAGSGVLTKIRETLENIFKTKLTDSDITILGGTDKTANYGCDIYFTKVDGNINKSFVLKCGKTSKELRKTAPVKEIYLNEIHLYDTVVKHFRAFEMEKGLNPFPYVPACYGDYNGNDFEMIVLENLSTSGFKMHESRMPMDLPHLELVLKAYAEWHALSIAFKDQKPDGFKGLVDNIIDVFNEFNKKNDLYGMFEKNVKLGHDLIKTALTPENNERLLKFINEIPSFLASIYANDGSRKPYYVINHGDAWNNNFLFKYKNKVPVDVRILDWQTTALRSPIYDITYFIFCAISRENLKNLDDLLRLYYDTLNVKVQELGSNLKTILPHKEFLEEFWKMSKIGLIFAFTTSKVCTMEKDEGFDMAESAENGQDPLAGFLWVPKNTKEFSERVLPVVEFFLENNLI